MRLTTDLIQNSLSYINPLNERELDLRGHKIPMIENLAVAGGQDAIDFTDNSLTQISNIPSSPRLRTLLLARNRISIISPSLANAAPNLTTIVLTTNRITNLADLDPLGKLQKLTNLSVLDNPVTREEHYRLWVIWRCKAVRYLDFTKVKQAERESAEELFGESEEEMTDLAKSIASKKAVAVAASDEDMNGLPGGRVKLTTRERKKVEAMIKSAKSLADIERLERELNEGRVPGVVIGADDDDDDEEMEE